MSSALGESINPDQLRPLEAYGPEAAIGPLDLLQGAVAPTRGLVIGYLKWLKAMTGACIEV